MEIQDEGTMSAACARHPAYDEAAKRWSKPGIRPDTILAEGGLPASGLTALEVDVLNGLALGLSEREIALRLMLFEPAVRAALRSIRRQLRARICDRVHAATRRRTEGSI